MAVTIYDIAKRANVSPSTISRALQDHPRIGAKTRRQIQALAKEMGYIPSDVARSLTTNRTQTIGMVVATTADPFIGRVVEGVEQAAIQADFNVFISTSQNDRRRELAVIETLQRRRVDGIIVVASHVVDAYWRHLERIHIPVVIIDEQDISDKIHFITVDDKQGAQSAVEYLIGLGHRRIGYVGVTNRPKGNQYRFHGYLRALELAGIAPEPALIFEDKTIESHAKRGEASLETLWAAGATAIFCYNDVTAIGLLSACYQRGLTVPDHLSVMGFDDIDMAAYAIPPLTTIRQPQFELGQWAMQMLLDLLNGEKPENQIVPGNLVIRQTTAGLLPYRRLLTP
ncbi:MAG: LacI family DNA-binding transcriptional regulator [Caldilineaceae bacterium]|nr:LacI family DNA-binding transcriptional regulator [Caldilineaceae bacterium]